MQRSLLKVLHNSLQNQNHLFKLLANPYHTNTNNESWPLLFSALAQGGLTTELALHKASKLLNSGARPNGYALTHLVRASTDLGLDAYCQQLHCYALKSGFGSDVFVSNALVGFYRMIESMVDAHKVFVEIPQPNVVSWNSLISGYVQSGQLSKALDLFLQLERSEVRADAYSFTLALSACGQLGLVKLGMSIHCKIVQYGLECGLVVGNCLIDLYGKCGSVEEAILVFYEMGYKDCISWNSVIAASARNQRLELAQSFLGQMPKPDTISYNELINGISQFGDIEDAVMILSKMPNPNSSSWNSIITGYVNRERVPQALYLFSKMHSNDIIMDAYTFSVLLSGIAHLAALKWGMLIHACTLKWGLNTSVVVGSALIDMYAKCGKMKNAESMFQGLPIKNLVTWNAMISGYAHNGDAWKAIQLLSEMKKNKDLKPDNITCLNVIAAYSNCDVPLQTAIMHFDSMINGYGIEPTVEHCCTMIRLMGQRGEAWRAGRMIHKLGFGSCGAVWKALLSACGACRDFKVAKIAAAKVLELEGDDDHVYVMMSNLFACYGKWADVSEVRKVMRERGLRKEVGYSWIQVEKAASISSTFV